MEISLEHQFLIAVLRAGRTWRRVADAVSTEFGLTEATGLPLLCLSQMAEAPRQADLAEIMGMEPPSVVWLIDQLTEMGLVERREDPDDKRAKRIYLTDQGRLATTRTQARVEARCKDVLASVDPKDLHVGLRVLEVVERFTQPSQNNGAADSMPDPGR